MAITERTVLHALLLLLARTAVCSCDHPVSPGAAVVAGLAAACSEGVRQAVQQELWTAANYTDSEGRAVDLPEGMTGLLRALHGGQSQPRECPSGWARHGDSCYLIPPQKTNWFRAHHACAVLHRGAQLASVHPDSGPFLEGMVASSGAEKAVWVGLFGSGKAAGDWVWSDGSPFDYAHWDRNQPDGGDPSCIHLGWPSYTNNLWHDNSCTVVINVLCQIKLT
ncbi:C-type lectin lectoxin-Enh4-like [Amphibalanus amphitrite]|uniref:C-type lectin lectoxin-Enh4-like n=1 Tax=Amphibalanus amphitrite TaxID=1232801 RepID=UPI001C910E47|nr:C-type lectin lectoxin-Enh4-like [Amphibalanus amphitrite]